MALLCGNCAQKSSPGSVAKSMTGDTGCLGLKTFGGGSAGSGVETAKAAQRIQSEKRAWNCVV